MSRLLFFLFPIVLLGATAMMDGRASAAPIEKAVVSSPSVFCLFSQLCSITVSDIAPIVERTPGAFFQSRIVMPGSTGSPGEIGTVAEGLYVHLYRVDLRNGIGNPSAPCVSEIGIPFGPHSQIDYDEDGDLDDFFEIQSNAVGSVAVSSADATDGQIRLIYEGEGVCTAFAAGIGESSYFVGFASEFPPTIAASHLSFGTLTLPEIVMSRVPEIPGPTTNQDYGFAWANRPTDSAYSPSSTYAYNRAGGPVTVSRSGVGRYRVTFSGMDTLWNTEGNAQVTAYDFSGASDAHCNTPGWGSDWVDVECFDNLGVAVDSQFTALLSKPMPVNQDIAYVHATQAGSSFYSPMDADVQNPGGGPTTITRSSVGSYSVEFGGFTVPFAVGRGLGGNVQVTSMNSGAVDCSVTTWSSFFGSAGVACVDRLGNPADVEFSLLWRMPRESFDLDAAYVWANLSTEAAYSPSFSFAFNPQVPPGLDPDQVTRLETGSYEVTFSRLDEQEGPTGGHVQVTAYGADETRCAVNGWGEESVGVDCFDMAGNPTDSRFTLLRLEPQAVPEPGLGAMLWVGAVGMLLGRRGPGGTTCGESTTQDDCL